MYTLKKKIWRFFVFRSKKFSAIRNSVKRFWTMTSVENDDVASPRKYPAQNMMNGSPRKKSSPHKIENPWVQAARDLERLKERSLSFDVRSSRD